MSGEDWDPWAWWGQTQPSSLFLEHTDFCGLKNVYHAKKAMYWIDGWEWWNKLFSKRHDLGCPYNFSERAGELGNSAFVHPLIQKSAALSFLFYFKLTCQWLLTSPERNATEWMKLRRTNTAYTMWGTSNGPLGEQKFHNPSNEKI